MVVAIIPTTGNDDAASIHKLQILFLEICAQLGLPCVSMSADGAATELAAQNMMDRKSSAVPEPFKYEYAHYGISINVPVFSKTGPLVSVTDPPHGMKTARNQPQYGTHTASAGKYAMTNRTLVELQEKHPESGLVAGDIKNVDKQDDGAARRLFHCKAFESTTYEDVEGRRVREEFALLSAYTFTLGPSRLNYYSILTLSVLLT